MNLISRSHERWLLALAIVMSAGVLFTTVTSAQVPEDPASGGVSAARPRPANTTDYITLYLKDKPLQDVLQEIGRQVGMNIVADPEIDEFVTISLEQIEWEEALEVIARQTECTMVRESRRLIRFTQPPPISIEFKDADLKVVLDLLAKQSGANIVIASDVDGKVTLSLRKVPWRDALNTIVKTAGFVTVEDTEGVTDIIRVVRPETLTKLLETRVYRLRHVRPPERYAAIIQDVDKQSLMQYPNDKVNPETDFTLLRALRGALSNDGEMQYDLSTNTLIVKDVATRLAEIEAIIQELDVEQPLVHVKVRFISTSSDDVLEAGLKFDLPDTPEREGVQISMFAPAAEPIVTDREEFTGVLDPLVANGGTYPWDIGHWEDLRDDFASLGVLDFTQTRILLSMVRDDDNSKIIQEPMLTTLDNHASTIFVGDAVPFAAQKVKQDQNGNIQVEIDENERSPINIGFTLYISPHVVPGTDTVQISVIPKVSTLTGTTSPLDGFERFQFATDDSSNLTTFIDLPRESSQTVVTYLRVQNGHTAVIGGLHSERKVEIETRIPILSRIPILGNLLTWRRKSTDINHLLILITPTIISNSGMGDELYKQSLEQAERYDYFIRKYGQIDDEVDDAAEDSDENFEE